MDILFSTTSGLDKSSMRVRIFFRDLSEIMVSFATSFSNCSQFSGSSEALRLSFHSTGTYSPMYFLTASDLDADNFLLRAYGPSGEQEATITSESSSRSSLATTSSIHLTTRLSSSALSPKVVSTAELP